jgi:hypothetical protein
MDYKSLSLFYGISKWRLRNVENWLQGTLATEWCEIGKKFKTGRLNQLRKYLPSLTEKISDSDHLTTGLSIKTPWESSITA